MKGGKPRDETVQTQPIFLIKKGCLLLFQIYMMYWRIELFYVAVAKCTIIQLIVFTGDAYD